MGRKLKRESAIFGGVLLLSSLALSSCGSEGERVSPECENFQLNNPVEGQAREFGRVLSSQGPEAARASMDRFQEALNAACGEYLEESE